MKTFIFAAMALTLSTTAHAQTYVQVGVGATTGNEHDTFDRGSWDAQFNVDKQGVSGLIGVGYDTGPVRIQLNGTAHRFLGDVAGSVEPGNVGNNGIAANGEGRKGSHNFIIVNLMPMLDITNRLSVGAGPNASVILGSTDYASQYNAGWVHGSDRKISFGYSAVAEYRYPVSKNTDVGLRIGYDNVSATMQMRSNGGRVAAERKVDRDLTSVMFTLNQKL